MKPTFKKQLRKLIIWLIAIFVLLFIFRFIYGYTKHIGSETNQTEFFDNISNSRKNYASKKYEVNTSQQSAVKVDQKYEKIAEIKTKSSKFEEEEKLARTEIETFNAIIQFEQKSGNKGARRLNLLIGVPPEKF